MLLNSSYVLVLIWLWSVLAHEQFSDSNLCDIYNSAHGTPAGRHRTCSVLSSHSDGCEVHISNDDCNHLKDTCDDIQVTAKKQKKSNLFIFTKPRLEPLHRQSSCHFSYNFRESIPLQ